MSHIVTVITLVTWARDITQGVPALLCVRSQVEMGTLAALIPSSLPGLSQGSTVYNLDPSRTENTQPDTPLADDSEQCSHPEPFLSLTQRRSFWETCPNVNSDS